MKIKTLYFLLLSLYILFGISKSNAQPVADSTWLPSAGETYYTYLTTIPNNFDKNFAGANITWDFSNLGTSNLPIDTANYFLPGGSNVNCYYPVVNLMDGNHNRYACFLKNADGFFRVGLYKFYEDNSYLRYKYSNKELIFKIPFAYNNIAYDTFAYGYTQVIDSAGTKTYIDSGQSVVGYSQLVYDGYGTLKLHDEEYSNVIRIKRTEITKDSSLVNNPNHIPPHHFGYETYYWYNSDFHKPLLAIAYTYNLSRTSTNTYDTTYTRTAASYTKMQTSGFSVAKQNEINIKAYTVAEGIKIESSESKNQALRLSLYNMQGKLVLQKDITISSNYLLPVNRLAAGKYILQVYTKEGANKSFSLLLK